MQFSIKCICKTKIGLNLRKHIIFILDSLYQLLRTRFNINFSVNLAFLTILSKKVDIPNRKISILVHHSLIAPEIEPLYLDVASFSPTSRSIYLAWEDIPKSKRNGALTGYKVFYKKFFEQKFQPTIIVPFGFKSITLEGLKPFTLYYIEILGFNVAGDGPPEFWVNKTLEDGW